MNSAIIAEPSYFRAALANQYNVILFAGSVSFAAALASWIPLVAGIVGEAIWLLAGPRSTAFRRRADASRDRVVSEGAIRALGPEYGPGLTRVRSAVTEIERACAARPDLSPQQCQEVSRRLTPVFQSYLGVCSTHQRLRRVAAQAPMAELQAELSSLHQSLATETDLGVRSSLRRAQTVAERRVRQLEANEAASRSLEMALQTLQRSLAYIEESAAGIGGASELYAEIDAAAAQLVRAALIEAERENDLSQGRVSVLPPALN